MKSERELILVVGGGAVDRLNVMECFVGKEARFPTINIDRHDLFEIEIILRGLNPEWLILDCVEAKHEKKINLMLELYPETSFVMMLEKKNNLSVPFVKMLNLFSN